MEHIKTPVTVKIETDRDASVFEADGGGVVEYGEIDWCKELALALNLHDDLMSLCEAVLRAELASDPETKRDYWRVATIAAHAVVKKVAAANA